MGLEVGGNAWAAVSHDQGDAGRVRDDGHADRCVCRRVLYGVRQQVRHDLTKPSLVSDHEDQFVRYLSTTSSRITTTKPW